MRSFSPMPHTLLVTMYIEQEGMDREEVQGQVFMGVGVGPSTINIFFGTEVVRQCQCQASNERGVGEFICYLIYTVPGPLLATHL